MTPEEKSQLEEGIKEILQQNLEKVKEQINRLIQKFKEDPTTPTCALCGNPVAPGVDWCQECLERYEQ